MSAMCLGEYLAAKLKADGYSGLSGDGCGCELDDLMPCDCPSARYCTPGYKHVCAECPHNEDGDDDCPIDDGPTGTFCVWSTKVVPR